MKWAAILWHRGSEWLVRTSLYQPQHHNNIHLINFSVLQTSICFEVHHFLIWIFVLCYKRHFRLKLKGFIKRFSFLYSVAGTEIPHSRFSGFLSGNFANYILKADICIPEDGRPGHTGCITSKTIRQPTLGLYFAVIKQWGLWGLRVI